MDDSKATSFIQQLDPLVLELLHPISRLSPVGCGKLLEKARHIHLEPGQSLGAKDCSWSLLYLLAGSLERALPGRQSEVLEVGSRGVDRPIFPEGGSRQARVTARDSSEILVLDQRLFELLLEQEREQGAGATDIMEAEGIESSLFRKFTDDFHRGRLEIPGVPGVAERVVELAGREDIGLGELSDLVALDPALAAMVVQAGGSGLDHCDIPTAVGALGRDKVRDTISQYGFVTGCRKHSPEVRQLMLKAHRHSLHVGAFSYVLATAVKGMNPDHALLCGLLHDVGMFPLLGAADQHRHEIGSSDNLKQVVWRLHGMISGLVLGSWGFGNDFVAMAEEADDWQRDTGKPGPDYTDVVLVAQLHSFIGTDRLKGLPQFANLSAFRRVVDQESAPRLSLWLLQKTNSRLLYMERLLEGVG